MMYATPATASPEQKKSGGGDGGVALAWWRKLTHPEAGDSGAMARLRRARSPLDALNVVAGADLARRTSTLTMGDLTQRTRTALDLARVLAHVKTHAETHPMRAAGFQRFPGTRGESADDRPRLSEQRFRRLIETGDGEEQVAAFTRLIALLDGTVNVRTIAADYLRWNHPDFADRVRERWAAQYYNAMSSLPTNIDEDPSA